MVLRYVEGRGEGGGKDSLELGFLSGLWTWRDIASGKVVACESKRLRTVKQLQSHINYLQRTHGLVTGRLGGWNGLAQAALEEWLLQNIKGRSSSPALAIEDEKQEHPQASAAIPLEDEKHESGRLSPRQHGPGIHRSRRPSGAGRF